MLGEIARDRQGHRDDAALRGGVSGLPDLALIGGDRGGRDDDAPLPARDGGRLDQRGRNQPYHIERTYEIDADHLLEVAERMRAIFPHHALGDANSRAIDEDARRAVRLLRLRDRPLRGGRVRHVGADGDAADRLRDRRRGGRIQIENRDPRALGGERFRGRAPQPRSGPRDDRRRAFDFHGHVLLIKPVLSLSSPRKRGSSGSAPTSAALHWIPAFAGMTIGNPHNRTTCGFSSPA